MAKSFIFCVLLKEAHELDIIASRRQARSIRALSLLSREDEYVRQYRLSEDLIALLVMDLKELTPTRRTRRSIDIRTKILCTLSFLASGSYQKTVGRNVSVYLSQPSVSRSIEDIVRLLSHPDMVKKYIRFPQNAGERLKLKSRFYEKFHIPGVIGCIDGTFVAIIRPKANEERYYCRKGFHARNVLLITDADLNILYVDCSFGGASHDSYIFNNSCIKSHLEHLISCGETVYLLGDSGYAQRPYMMTPILREEEGTPGAYYNKLHATARNSVERTIGVLKGRFRCLLAHRVLHYHPDTAARIIIACCVLHNMCNRAGLPPPQLTDQDVLQENILQERQPLLTHDLDLSMGRTARNQLITLLWNSR